MKYRILTIILGLCVLFGVILALPGCSSSKENGETYAYIFFPNGKMLVSGEVEAAWHGSNGLLGITIDGIEYQTHCMNAVLETKRADI
ncbi:hypothetical protein [Bacteroides clarus]|uniref:hypothetical protein n=1 Tax=Bacteroides clarus TaxID=626929 RepID=UPI00248F06E2|nr:hypothetical protein [Bacteroides clarus]